MRKINPVYKPYWNADSRFRLLFGGAGSSKSVTAAQYHISLAADPRVRVLTLRKVGKTCRHSTFQLYQDVLEALGRLDQVVINKTEMRITFPGGGEILHAGLDDVRKLKSITGVTHIWVEEATELDFPADEVEAEPDLAQIDLRLRGVDPGLKPSITCTFNPTRQAADIFDYVGVSEARLPERGGQLYRDGDVYVQHTTYEDNPWVGEDYVSVFDRLGGTMQKVYRAGQLAQVDDPDQVIPYEFVKRAVDLEPEGGMGYLGVDVARYGNDKTVLAHKQGNDTYELERHQDLSTDRTATITANHIRERSLSPNRVGVDAIGIGAGVVDNLKSVGFDVVPIVSGEKPARYQDGRDTKLSFYNLRSQMWWVMRERLRAGLCSLSTGSKQLIEDLCAPRYELAAERTVKVEPKEKVKERIGRSPDDGDAAVYCEALTELEVGVPSMPGTGFDFKW